MDIEKSVQALVLAVAPVPAAQIIGGEIPAAGVVCKPSSRNEEPDGRRLVGRQDE
jgi:hypothetical protein